MNYQSLVTTFKTIINDHKFIKTFGYGSLSDIAVPEGKKSPDYPYAFINPVSVTQDSFTSTFSFNLILMTQVLDEESDELYGQSICIKYINDLVSAFNLASGHPNIYINTPFNIVPFKERFQDDVVGVTAQLDVFYDSGLSVCESPIFESFDQAPPTGGTPPPIGVQTATVIDSDGTTNLVEVNTTFTCQPIVPKSGIVYQRQIPWEGNDPGVTGSVYWHRENGTYDNYVAPINPINAALLKNGYNGTDADCELMYDNAFGNRYRFTNDVGQQFIEDFHIDPNNQSDNPKYCIDHLSGLAFYVQRGGNAGDNEQVLRSYIEGVEYANNFSYGGFSDWRLADVSEYLNAVNYNDWQNSFNNIYSPFIDTALRQYGGSLLLGSYTKDNQYIRILTNSATINTRTNLNEVVTNHLIMVRNHYI